MIPYDKLTIIRNRHRARDLRIFRELVETYFERSEYITDEMPVDWDGARVARSQINRMLPRMIQIVHAAGLDSPTLNTNDPRPLVADVEILRNIFSARFVDGADQEILDLIDMALGVYDAHRFNALVRTVNPLHYVMAALGFVAGLPRRGLAAIGFGRRRPRGPSLRPEDLNRLEAVASRLARAEESFERRFGEMRDRQAQQLAHNAGLLEELAERLDFAERVLAQREPEKRLKAAEDKDVATPV